MKIKEIIAKAIKNLGVEGEVLVERPSDETRGDFACNVALVEGRKIGRNPRELAEEWVEELKKDKDLELVVDKIEVAGPGFINFWIRPEYLSLAMSVCETAKNTWQSELKGKKVLVEYSSPNIAKRFSVGHLRSTIVGQAIFNLYKACGAKVTNDNHLGDWGTQFGMIVAAIEEESRSMNHESWFPESIGELEELYVRFNKRIEDNPELKDKAREAFARLEAGDKSARKIWQQSIDVSMEEFEEIYKKLGVSFENNYGESFFESTMPEVIAEAKERRIAEEGEKGAWIVKFEEDGKEIMPPAMLVKGDGSTTYFTRDLATVKQRIMDPKLKSDLYIYEVGGEQRLHLRQVFAAAKKLWPKETKGRRFVHVAHGLLTLPEGKMSTRKGNTIKLEDLINMAEVEALDKMASVSGEYGLNTKTLTGEYFGRKMNTNEAISLAKQMGINAIKYNELRRSPGMDYVFTWEEALAMVGNSAPYINYAFVRAHKIVDGRSSMVDDRVMFEGEEVNLARWLMRYLEGEIVEEAAKNFAPQLVCAYLFETAKRFNAFYDQNPVLDDPREKERLVLVKAVAEVIKNGMAILGIEVVEKM